METLATRLDENISNNRERETLVQIKINKERTWSHKIKDRASIEKKKNRVDPSWRLQVWSQENVIDVLLPLIRNVKVLRQVIHFLVRPQIHTYVDARDSAYFFPTGLDRRQKNIQRVD